MKLVAHRGVWKTRDESNSLEALEDALKQGLSLETDLRSYQGQLYLSHDPIVSSRNVPKFSDLLGLARKYPLRPLFINIKEDGLVPYLQELRKPLEELDIVFFDMSIPQLVQFAKTFPKANLCTRISDVETAAFCNEACDWLWIDGFERNLNASELEALRKKHNKKIVYVSPELHGRNPTPFWNLLKEDERAGETYLCTDLLNEAKQVFAK